MSSVSVEHGGGLTKACRLYGGRPADWLDLSTGINPSPVRMPDLGLEVWNRLPDDHLHEAACEQAARHFDLPAGTMPLAVPGTQSAIQHLPMLGQGKAAILGPTYVEYERCFLRAGNPVRTVRDFDELDGDERFVVVVNPNNPDGRIVPPSVLESLATDLAGRNGLLIVDEAFCDLTPEHSLAPLATTTTGIVVLRSFGKFFGLAGLRLGFVIAQDPLIARFRDAYGPWAVSGPALAIAASVYADRLLVENTMAVILERRKKLDDILGQSGLETVGGTGLFALVRHGEAGLLHEGLCRKHILVRKFDYDRQWLRFGLPGDDVACRRLQSALSGLLKET